MGKTKLLASEKQISEYLNGASRYLITKYRKMGAPIRKVQDQLVSHEEALDEFFKNWVISGGEDDGKR